MMDTTSPGLPGGGHQQVYSPSSPMEMKPDIGNGVNSPGAASGSGFNNGAGVRTKHFN